MNPGISVSLLGRKTYKLQVGQLHEDVEREWEHYDVILFS